MAMTKQQIQQMLDDNNMSVVALKKQVEDQLNAEAKKELAAIEQETFPSHQAKIDAQLAAIMESVTKKSLWNTLHGKKK